MWQRLLIQKRLGAELSEEQSEMAKRTKLVKLPEDFGFAFTGTELVEVVAGTDAGLRGTLVNYLAADAPVVVQFYADEFREYPAADVQLVTCAA